MLYFPRLMYLFLMFVSLASLSIMLCLPRCLHATCAAVPRKAASVIPSPTKHSIQKNEGKRNTPMDMFFLLFLVLLFVSHFLSFVSSPSYFLFVVPRVLRMSLKVATVIPTPTVYPSDKMLYLTVSPHVMINGTDFDTKTTALFFSPPLSDGTDVTIFVSLELSFNLAV